MRMYFRTDYKEWGPAEATLQKGHWYKDLCDAGDFYIIDNRPESNKCGLRLGEISFVDKEDLEDDVYVVTGKSEEFEEGGGAI